MKLQIQTDMIDFFQKNVYNEQNNLFCEYYEERSFSMKLNENNHISIADITFSKPDKEQFKQITTHFQNLYLKAFKKRIFTSLICAFIVILAEIIGRTNLHTTDTIIPMITTVIIVFFIFNLISFIYMKIKSNMNDIMNKYECTHGIITEKFDSKHIEQTTNETASNYILFSNEQGHCVTALSTKNKQLFQSLKISDEILVIRYCPMGNVRYEFFKI